MRVSTLGLGVALKLTPLLELCCRYIYVQSYSLLIPMVLCWLGSSLWTGLVADADHCHSQALIKCLHLLVKALPLLLCPQPHLPGLLPSLSSQPTLSLAAAAPDCSNSVSLAISVMEAVKKDEEGFLFSETTYNWECRETAIRILPFPCPLSISF